MELFNGNNQRRPHSGSICGGASNSSLERKNSGKRLNEAFILNTTLHKDVTRSSEPVFNESKPEGRFKIAQFIHQHISTALLPFDEYSRDGTDCPHFFYDHKIENVSFDHPT